MRTPISPSADKATAAESAGERVIQDAFVNYENALAAAHTARENERAAREATAQRDYEVVASLAGTMRVLYMTYMDFGPEALVERNDPTCVHDARADGFITGDRPRLTEDGLTEWWSWKTFVYDRRHEPRYQQLWRDVITW